MCSQAIKNVQIFWILIIFFHLKNIFLLHFNCIKTYPQYQMNGVLLVLIVNISVRKK